MHWLARGEEELPADLVWLSPREREQVAGIRFTKRRNEYLTRRWAAKHAVATVLRLGHERPALASIEIHNRDNGAPWVHVGGEPAPLEVSLTDRAGWAVCLCGELGSGSLGVDLELVEPRSDGFVDDFLTIAERALVHGLPRGDPRHEAANLMWSAKEAALKVLQVGLRADTRSVAVTIGRDARPDGWAPLNVRHEDGADFPGWWRRDGVFLLTIAGRQPSDPPQLLPGGADLVVAEPAHRWVDQPFT